MDSNNKNDQSALIYTDRTIQACTPFRIQQKNYALSPTSQKLYQHHNKENQTHKILSLQEQLLNTRKQLSQKQANWQKQRNNFLTQQEISNMEIIQSKQRIVNLTQINQTLTDVLANGEFMEDAIQKIKQMTFKILGTQLNTDIVPKKKAQDKQRSEKNRILMLEPEKQRVNKLQIENKGLKQQIRKFKENTQALMEKIQQLKQQVHKKQVSLKSMNQKCKELCMINQTQEEKLLGFYKQMSSFENKKISHYERNDNRQSCQPQIYLQNKKRFSSSEKQNKSLQKKSKKTHKQLTLQQLDLNVNQKKNNNFHNESSYLILKTNSDQENLEQNSDTSSYFNELSVHDQEIPLQNQYHSNQNFRKKSNSKIMKQKNLNRQQKYYQQSEPSEYSINGNYYNEDEYQNQEQKLLCEVCNRVFGFQQFQLHMDKCGYQSQQQQYIRNLLLKKKQITNKLEQLQEQQKSVHHYRQSNSNVRQKQYYNNQNKRSNNYKQFPIKKSGSSNYHSSHYAGFSIKNYQ